MDTAVPHDRPDPFVAVRQAFWAAGGSRPARAPGGLPVPAGALAPFLRAEYLPSVHPGTLTDPADHTVARLRRALRLGLPATPEELVAAALRPERRLRATVAEAWPGSLHRYGPARAGRALRRELPRHTDPRTLATLIALATAGGLPLPDPAGRTDPDRTGPFAARPVRHALWRHLAARPDGRRLLPDPATGADPYERLLLAAAAGADVLAAPPIPRRGGLLVVQSMLLGAMDSPGEGSGGGLGVLLGGLGDALVRTDAVDGVLTLVTARMRPSDRGEPELLRPRGPGHWTLGLPVDDAGPDAAGAEDDGAGDAAHGPDDFGAASWWAARLLGALERRPDLVHVRYADDASLAVAEAARRLGARLVFTATPDPHRRIGERHGATRPAAPADREELRRDLHRVFVADRLVQRADEVVGIPGPGGDGADATAELLRHFPQLAGARGGRGPAAPPEGITAYHDTPDTRRRGELLLERLFGAGERVSALDPDARRLPLLLTVGRLHPLKQQHLLVRAWIESGLCLRSTLVVVGGSVRADAAEPAERDVRAALAALRAEHPGAAARLALVPALPNAEVRCLERALARSGGGAGRAYYVCPSAKEEFGIAVLEAMDAGLPVAATARGGVPHYLEDTVNGLLLDTSSAGTLARGIDRLLALSDEELGAMTARAAATVRGRYSIDAAATAFAAVYAGRGGDTETARLPARAGRRAACATGRYQ
ncbi:glycosyltransferase family 4 protein [Streptomyces subrutilus]|uniref:glycosyltransferase family 4 protein n=1 Tax=Streptomyces subrutilus TaxID=36818 RepID=UPI002E10A57F|nr:glycosyltransferase family 4 protein [Streptomyces subrutilus]